MSDEKPKFTEAQLEELSIYYNEHPTLSLKDAAIACGYMEVPETALERAERLYNEWGKEPSQDEDEEGKINDIIDAFREAIAELKETIKYTQVG